MRRTTAQNRVVPFIAPTLAVILALAANWPFLHRGFAPAVVGYNLVPAERVLSGEIPYRDFLYNYTPGVLWLNAALFKFLGTTLLSARVGVFAARVIGAGLLFFLSRRYLGRWTAIIPVAIAMAWIGYGDILKVFPTQYGMPLLLLSSYSVLRASDAVDKAAGAGWLAAAGAAAGGVTLLKQNVGLFTLLAAMCAVFFFWREGDEGGMKDRLMRTVIVLGGFGAVILVASVYLASEGALAPMFEHFARHGTAYSEEKGMALPSPLLLVPVLLIAALVGARLAMSGPGSTAGLRYRQLLIAAAFVVIALGEGGLTDLLYRSLVAQVYYLPIYVAVGTVVLIALGRRRANTDPIGPAGDHSHLDRVVKNRDFRLMTLTLFSLAAFLEIFPRSDADHLVRMLPPSLLLACALVHELTSKAGQVGDRSGDQLSPRPISERLFSRDAALLWTAALIVALGLRMTWVPQLENGLSFRESYPLEFERGRGVNAAADEAARANALVAYVQSHTQPDDPILALSRKMTGVYFLAARPNTTRVLWYDSAGIPDEERAAVEQRIEEKGFKLILIGGELAGKGSSGGSIDPAVARAVAKASGSYRFQASIGGVTILGPE